MIYKLNLDIAMDYKYFHSVVHGKGGSVIPKPFERDIFLFDSVVAGTSHIVGIEELAEHLDEGEKLDFYREPKNEFDNQAIAIKTVNGTKIGYVQRKDNAVFARLMDAGKLLIGRIDSVQKCGTWVKIKIKIYLHEQ